MFDHFNFLAPIYDRVIQPRPPQRLTELLEIQPDHSLLDVGGGTGRISQFFPELARQVIVADLSFKMLLKSTEKNGLLPVNNHSECLPFPDRCFERIVMVDALHHVCDQHQTAKELWRVVKQGGRIVIEEPDISSWGVKLVALGEKIALMRSHFLGGQEIMALFDAYDAAVQIVKEEHFLWVVIDKN